LRGGEGGASAGRFQTIPPQPINAAIDRAAVVARFVEVGSFEVYS